MSGAPRRWAGRRLPRGVPLLVLLVPFAPAVAVAPGDAEVERLIKQLGSDKFKEREAASKRLIEIGGPALAALYKAETSADEEVRRRVEKIVAVVEGKLYPELRLTGHTGRVLSVCVAADGTHLLTSGVDKTLRLWDARTGEQLRIFAGHTAEIYSSALWPDGQRELSGSIDRTVRLWDAATGKELREMTGHAREVNSVAFGPKGKVLSAGYDREMYLWEPDTGKAPRILVGHTEQGYGVGPGRCRPDGRGRPPLRRRGTPPADRTPRCRHPAGRRGGGRVMLTLLPGGRILAAVEPVDGREGIDSLAGVVRSALLGNPMSGDL